MLYSERAADAQAVGWQQCRLIEQSWPNCNVSTKLYRILKLNLELALSPRYQATRNPT
jgi:hypothetical protein